METIQVKDRIFEPFIREEELLKEIKRVASEINRDYVGKEPLFLCVLNGSFMFAADLLKNVSVPCNVSFVKVASYSGTDTTGKVKELMGLQENVEGRHVIIVEDIVDTGRTLSHLFKILNERKPASVRLCTLLDKPERRVVDDVHVNYTGFQVEDEFVVGYGLDYDQRYRNLPYIGVIHFDD